MMKFYLRYVFIVPNDSYEEVGKDETEDNLETMVGKMRKYWTTSCPETLKYLIIHSKELTCQTNL